jgi:hypothetical protein
MLHKLVEVAADEVSVEIMLPQGFSLDSFSGEESSTDPEHRVQNVVLARGDDMTMLARFRTLDVANFDGDIVITVRYRPLSTGAARVFEQRLAIAELTQSQGILMARTRLVDAYARWACACDAHVDAQELLAELRAFEPTDTGLQDITTLLAQMLDIYGPLGCSVSDGDTCDPYDEVCHPVDDSNRQQCGEDSCYGDGTDYDYDDSYPYPHYGCMCSGQVAPTPGVLGIVAGLCLLAISRRRRS